MKKVNTKKSVSKKFLAGLAKIQVKSIISLALLSLFFLIPAKIKAIPAYPFPVEFKQPNGEVIIIQAHGDEYFHYVTTADNYLVELDKDGYLTYAEINNDGRLVPGNIRVSNNVLKSSQTGRLKADSEAFITKVQQPALSRFLKEKLKNRSETSQLRASSAVTGNKRGLVILANFSDVKFKVENALNSFTNMLNQVGYSANGATGSARDYFMANSNNQFIPQFDVFGPVDLPNPMAYYGENDNKGNDKNSSQFIIDACLAAKAKYPDMNFSNYAYNKPDELDFVFVIYAGYNEAENSTTMPNTIWPHKSTVLNKNVTIDGVKLGKYACSSELRGSSGTNMAGIGTFTHEFSHVLGLPDFYDTDAEVNGTGTGTGFWSLLDSGGYLNEGRTPPNYGAMEQYLLGWISPTIITPTTSSVSKSLPPIITPSNNQAFRLDTPTPNEFYLFESRKKQGWDAYLLGEGMLVYHVDMTTTSKMTVTIDGNTYTVSAADLWSIGRPNMIGAHQCMDMLRANNNAEVSASAYAGNPYPSGSVTSISDYTTPGFLSWNNLRTYAQVSNITRNATDGSVRFDIVKNTSSPYPNVQTNDVTNIYQTSATFNASLLENGTSAVTERGFCWGTAANPTTQNSTVKVTGVDLGAFKTDITNLKVHSSYHVRAYVKTQDGNTYYGNDVSFTTLYPTQKVPYSESFINGGPGYWTVINGNNDGSTWWFLSKDDIKEDYGIAGLDGIKGTANDWLISPQIRIPAGSQNVKLLFTVAYFSNEVLDVKFSTTSIDTTSFKSISGSPISMTDPDYWWVYTVPFGATLNNKDVFFAFVNRTKGGDQMYITDIQVIGDFPTGIEEIKTANAPSVYAQGELVYFKNILEKFTAEIYDTAGRLQDRIMVSSDMSKVINTPGIYFVKLKNDKQTYTYKIIMR